METKLEQSKVPPPYEFTIVLNEEELRGLRHFLGSVSYDCKPQIKRAYEVITEKEIMDAWSIQNQLFTKCANAVDYLDADAKSKKKKTSS